MYIDEKNLEEQTGITLLKLYQLTGITGFKTPPGYFIPNFSKSHQFPELQVGIVLDGVKLIRKINFEEKIIFNMSFELQKGMQRQGIGYKVFSEQVKYAKEYGFKEIRCRATGNWDTIQKFNGYITWAKFGYTVHELSMAQYSEILIRNNISLEPIFSLVNNPNIGEGVTGETFWTEKGRTWMGAFHLDKEGCVDNLNQYANNKGYSIP